MAQATENDDPSFAAQDDLISLASHMRHAGCRLPSLTSSIEKEAYAKVAVASSKVRFLLFFLSKNIFEVAYLSVSSSLGSDW